MPELECSSHHRRNRSMGHVGRVPTNFGDNRNQVYLVPQLKQLAVTIRWTRDLQTWMSQ